MKIFVVHAHPEPKSFTSALKDRAIEHFRSDGHEVRVSDLYEVNWNPVASAADFGARKDNDYLVYALEQRHGCETDTIAADIQDELEKLVWCDLLILNFPIFWFSTPAILKGWIDRVLVSGLCYGGKRFYDRGGMRGRRAMTTVTLGGRPHMFGKDAIHGELDDMLRHLLRGTLAYTGFDVLPPFVGYHVPYIGHEERIQILEDYEVRLSQVDSITPLRFVSMDEFDDRLYPIAK